MKVTNILFTCSGNVHRSALAEGLFRKMVGNRNDIVIDSAALCETKVSCKPDPNIRKVADELGVDLRGHRSKMITRAMVDQATFIVPMAAKGARAVLEKFPDVGHKIHLLNSFRTGLPRDVPSPAYKTYELCLGMRTNISAALPSLLTFIGEGTGTESFF